MCWGGGLAADSIAIGVAVDGVGVRVFDVRFACYAASIAIGRRESGVQKVALLSHCLLRCVGSQATLAGEAILSHLGLPRAFW